MRIILMRLAIFVTLALPAQIATAQDERTFRLSVAAEIRQSGLMEYILPRFALKSGRRAELVAAAGDARIEPGGGTGSMAVFVRGEEVYFLTLESDNDAARVFCDWILSDPGQAAIAAFRPEAGAPFGPPPEIAAPAQPGPVGNAPLGLDLSVRYCAHCHRVAEAGAGSAPGMTLSFAALRALPDWESRFRDFYALNPHPSLIRITGVQSDADRSRRGFEMTLAEVEAILAYVAAMTPADLGAPVVHQ